MLERKLRLVKVETEEERKARLEKMIATTHLKLALETEKAKKKKIVFFYLD